MNRFLLLFALLASATVTAAPATLHISSSPVPATLLMQHPMLQQAATIDADALPRIRSAQALSIDVFGRSMRIERAALDPHPGGWVWQGPVNGGEGWAQFSYYQGRLAGYIQPTRTGQAIEIRPMADGNSSFVELDPSMLPQPDKVVEPPPTEPGFEVGTRRQVTTDSGHGIDVLVAYTPAAGAQVGGYAGVVARAYADVAWANHGIVYSGIDDLRMRLTAVKQLFLNEPTSHDGDDWGDFLSSFQQSATADAWRNQYGADLMALYVHEADPITMCGLGYVMADVGPSFAPWAYQITWIECSARTFAHESGHNMGMEHDPANTDTLPADASYPYAFGYGESDGDDSFRTIMAYANVCGGNPCTQIWAYSTPDRYWNNKPVGTSNNNNARVLRNTRNTVANFRPSKMIFQDGFD